jgi:UTP--glucose-1-phosphate uridylyltransferase
MPDRTTITKAIIPAAGWGTRMLPAAKAVPKELLPILDRPTIQYVVEEAADAGIDDVLLITQREKRAIEDHFDRNAELEERLRAGKKEAFLASVTALASRVQLHAVRQSEQRGLGHAVLHAARHAAGQHVLCMLGDTIFSGAAVLPAKQLIDAHAALGGQGTIVALEEVPADRVDRYGIAGGTRVGDGVMKISELVEKPSVEQAPSRFAICARYVLSPTVFELLRTTPPGKGNEIQLTDALKAAIAREPVHGVVLKAKRHDIGNPADWLLTNILYASRDPALWSKVEPALRRLLDTQK